MNCRICKKEIKDGTLCNKCLKSLDDELMTIEERSQRNEMVKSEHDRHLAIGSLMVIIGIIGLFVGIIISPLFVVAICLIVFGAIYFLIGFFKNTSFCPACQRKKCLEDISRDLIGEFQTTIRERRKIERTRHEGGRVVGGYPETYEMEVDAPAVERHYRITYKCNKCGYIGTREESETVKI
ncbi:hypothetical protein [Ructibacterium gallinarum]|uniref:Uncharacterized protein n=1 Tax=Ructibacterium gallinarum TaxID=2779355 RepID=A0A9D5R8N0_9FIRM|nr:hypothetical protein [Ructibacterium gallinarum]MBE5040137.1 hypothetical protein [Ructibacterium gallinarum]